MAVSVLLRMYVTNLGGVLKKICKIIATLAFGILQISFLHMALCEERVYDDARLYFCYMTHLCRNHR